jgi:hypothetical protein
MADKDERKDAHHGEYLTEGERKKLLASLHRVLVWVGEKEPEQLQIDRAALEGEMDKHHQTARELPAEIHSDKGTVDLHELIWRLIQEKEITEEEVVQIEELIDLLEKKERADEEILRDEDLTEEEARRIYREAAGVIRALLDLRDLKADRERTLLAKSPKEKAEEIRSFAKRYMEDGGGGY